MATPTATTVAKINNINIVVIENGEKRVAIKPICEALGISYEPQFTRLKNDPILGSTITIIVTVGADKRHREMATIPFKFVFGWLFMIDSRKIHSGSREFVLKYQLECYNALYNHFQEITDYLKERDALAEAKFEEVEKAREDFRDAKNRLDTKKEEFKEFRAMTFELWKAKKAQMSLEFPDDIPSFHLLPDKDELTEL